MKKPPTAPAASASTAAGASELALRLSSALWGPLLMHNAERAARLLRHAPGMRPQDQGVAVTSGLRYGPEAWQRYDLYRPSDVSGPLPLVLSIHGGGFQFFDRVTHWPIATEIARHGYVVAQIDYRLAPRHRYPAAVEDVSAAYVHLAARARELGADPTRFALAGESAGANLVLGLAIARCWRRPEAHARAVWDAPMHPSVLLPACGYLQISEPERHERLRPVSAIIGARIHTVSNAYLPDHAQERPDHAFASPLLMLERAGVPERPFPATMAIVGGDDPVQDDTLRLGPALTRLRVPHEVRVTPGRGHAFHALTFQADARDAWRAQMAFVARHLAAEVAS